MTPPRAQRGFTLIELMITVAVVAVLAKIAYPAFTDQLRKSHRAEAQQSLMDLASKQQQLLLDTRNYGTVTATVTAYYSISVGATSTAAVNEFTATAVPLNSQAADKCGTLSVNHLNVKTPTGCW